MKQRGVYTIPPYPGWSNQQLTKNCGQVPYLLYKNYGFHAVMAGSKVDESYPYAEYVKGMDIEFFSDSLMKTRLDYICKNASDMDLFILHGPDPMYIPMVRCYRAVRPDGKIYLELDPNSFRVDRILWDTEEFRYLLMQSDVIGSSSRKLQASLSRKWPCKVEYLPNGFYNFANLDMNVNFAEKEDIILTVGRIGTIQKDNELLLEAFARIYREIPSWSIRFVGSVEPAFLDCLQRYTVRYPGLKRRIHVVGLIQDKAVLMNEYRKAKIFALTSIYEGGTPNVIAEALYMGNYVVTSDIDASIDATDDERCGSIFPIRNVHLLAQKLLEICQNPERLKTAGQHAIRYAKSTYDSEQIVDYLYYLLYGGSEETV